MAKSVRNPKIDSRTARAKLKPSGKPYWDDLGDRLHLGYRKGKHEGVWVLRRYLGLVLVKDKLTGKYAVETIGTADDLADADGVKVLTFHQAQDMARERVKQIAEEARIAALGPAVTVRDIVEEYLKGREAREEGYRGESKGQNEDGAKLRGLRRDARSRLTKHVDKELAAKPLAALTEDDLAKWRSSLAQTLGSPQRVVSDFKAALNAAAKRHKAKLPPNFRETVKDGLAKADAASATAREAQVLTDGDVRRIISAAREVDAEGDWGGDLARVILVLAATGSRFSQIIRMTVADVQAKQKRLMVPTSRKGRGTKQKTHTMVPVGDDVLDVLKKATAGRKGHEPLFLRPHWKQVGPARWEKGERGPWYAAAELTRPWAAIVARAGLATGTIPYAFRHSSIVRGLCAGLPVRLVASLHDTSSAMIEKHYGHFVDDALSELAARAVVPLTTAPAIVTPIESARAGH